MSNLDNLISKIIYEAEEEAKIILQDANDKSNLFLNNTIKELENEKKAALLKSTQEANKKTEQVILANKLKIRDELINAKQTSIDNVFKVALENLNAMSKDDYFKFVIDSLSKEEINGEEIIISKKYDITNIDELNSYLKLETNNNLTLYEGDREINGGFILVKNGIENNNTFETLINYYRYELEGEVIDALF